MKMRLTKEIPSLSGVKVRGDDGLFERLDTQGQEEKVNRKSHQGDTGSQETMIRHILRNGSNFHPRNYISM